MKTFEQLKEFYQTLTNEFEGYIQMSNEKLNKIYLIKQSLPSWEELHQDKGFIYEACFFDGDRSVTIRQFNNGFLIIDKNLSDFEIITQEKFMAKSDEEGLVIKAKISQIWEEKEDENCLNKKVLKPTLLLFSGFEKGDLQ